MKLLSIDWDYFFPDSAPYDWGANEENAFFFEGIWACRTDARNLLTGAAALEEYVPTIPAGFWKLVKNAPVLYVAESHSRIVEVVETVKPDGIVSLDAHHDSGYGRVHLVDCGNWAAHVDVPVVVHYPAWRCHAPERTPTVTPAGLRNDLPKPDNYAAVFVCRSGCWCPPWFDADFRKFVESSKLPRVRLDNYVWKVRPPDIEEARRLKLQFSELHAHHERFVRALERGARK